MRQRPIRRAERGVTMLMVLVLLSVMLLGGLAMARLSEVSTLASGNAAWRDSALQASEAGVNTAFAAVRALANEDSNVGNWYSATALPKDADGLPTGVNWDTAPEVVVGTMSVRYVVERACTVTPVTMPLRQCLVSYVPGIESYSQPVNGDKLEPASTKQFRITVRVTGPKGTQTFVQSLVTKGMS